MKAPINYSVTTAYHVTPASNLPSIEKTGLEPRLGVRCRACHEQTPGVFLFASIDNAEHAVMNWLGEEFSDEPLSLLKIDLTPDLPLFSHAPWELMTTATIAPASITVLRKDI